MSLIYSAPESQYYIFLSFLFTVAFHSPVMVEQLVMERKMDLSGYTGNKQNGIPVYHEKVSLSTFK